MFHLFSLNSICALPSSEKCSRPNCLALVKRAGGKKNSESSDSGQQKLNWVLIRRVMHYLMRIFLVSFLRKEADSQRIRLDKGQ